MALSSPQECLTPLVLLSEYAWYTNSDTSSWSASQLTAVRQRLLNASQLLSVLCNRRFDEVIETFYYTPAPRGAGGDLVTAWELDLGEQDLKSCSAIVNGDGKSINPADTTAVKFVPVNSFAKNGIRLNPRGVNFWLATGTVDPEGSISVTGTWGYGGNWNASGATLSENMTDTTSLTFTFTGTLEVGMFVKIDSEFLLISAIAGSTATVSARGYNGSTAATHTSGATIYRFAPFATVQRMVVRLAMWMAEQDKAPLFGQAVVGDVVIPVAVDALPKDLIVAIAQSGLMRMQIFGAV